MTPVKTHVNVLEFLRPTCSQPSWYPKPFPSLPGYTNLFWGLRELFATLRDALKIDKAPATLCGRGVRSRGAKSRGRSG